MTISQIQSPLIHKLLQKILKKIEKKSLSERKFMTYLRMLLPLFKGTFINLKTMTFILGSKKKKRKKNK